MVKGRARRAARRDWKGPTALKEKLHRLGLLPRCIPGMEKGGELDIDVAAWETLQEQALSGAADVLIERDLIIVNRKGEVMALYLREALLPR